MITEEQFPFLSEKGHVVSLVGGGGKTTLMYAMARLCAQKGWHVLVTTTTHIMRPTDNRWAQTEHERNCLWAEGGYAVAGTLSENDKLSMPPIQQLEKWIKDADAVFVEADGAKRLPCKVPAAHEPVLLPQSDIVLGVVGLSALQKPLQQVCFRAELAAFLLNVPQTAVLTMENLAKILASEQGSRKAVNDRSFYAVLNQADTPWRVVQGREIRQILRQNYGLDCVLTQFEMNERIL